MKKKLIFATLVAMVMSLSTLGSFAKQPKNDVSVEQVGVACYVIGAECDTLKGGAAWWCAGIWGSNIVRGAISGSWAGLGGWLVGAAAGLL